MYARFLFLLVLCSPTWVQAANNNSTYFTIRQDMRKCAAPLCGGFFVQRVNKPATVCADASRQAECYVAEIDLSALNATEEQKAALLASITTGNVLLRGSVDARQFGDFGSLGVFALREVWNAATETSPRGSFFRVVNNGIVCVTEPCPSLREEKLNTRIQRDVAGLELKDAGASEAQMNEAHASLDKPGGILAAGNHRTITGPGGTGLSLRARQFYLPAAAAASSGETGSGAPGQCVAAGCSSQLCVDGATAGSTVTTCEFRPEYACYQTAKCEAQADGKCGWTPSATLRSCLDAATTPTPMP